MRLRQVQRLSPRNRRRAALFVAGLVGLVVGFLTLGPDGQLPNPPLRVLPADAPDPFAYSDERREEFERRARAGLGHVLYAKSPGGVLASARRTARWRGAIERIAGEEDVDPDLLEAIVLLESAGRPDAVAGDLEGAVGLTQILAGTGQELLDMRVDLRASRRIGRAIERARAGGDDPRAERLRARRRRVDERFDPQRSLRATADYINFARKQLGGDDDLAIASYHMGVGNLQGVIAAFGEGSEPAYAQLFFDSTPTRHAAAYRKLAALGDDSKTYYWRVLASREIMHEWREDRDRLARTARLEQAKNSAEERLHPGPVTAVFDDPDELEDAYRDGDLEPFRDAPRRTGLHRDPGMGQLAPKLERGRRLYRGLRPEAYALALYIVRLQREAGGGQAPLTVTSTVRDRKYQGLLVASNPEATQNYSLHTTGWAFDVLRDYSGGAQAQAFQYALDRLQALDLIAWVREPKAIHVTVSGDARRLEPLLAESGDGG